LLHLQLCEQTGFAAEGAAGGAFEFLHEGFEGGVGGVALGGVFDGVAEGGVLIAAGAGEVVEVLKQGGEAGGGVAAFGEFGGVGGLAGGSVGTDDFVLGAARLPGHGLSGGGNGGWGGVGHDGSLLDYQETVGGGGGCQAGNAAKSGRTKAPT